MKITTLNPQIITSDAAPIMELFQALGFEQSHNKKGEEDVVFSAHRMKNPDGFHIDIINTPIVPKEFTTIRINVDNFDEAYELFMSKGFREAKVLGQSETASSKFVYLVSPSGFIVGLCQHIK